MAGAREVSGEVAATNQPTVAASLAVVNSDRRSVVTNFVSGNSTDRSRSQLNMQHIVHMFPSLRLNPMAEEFVPSQTLIDQNQMALDYSGRAPPVHQNSPGHPHRIDANTYDRGNYRNVYSQDRRRLTEALRSFSDLREDRYRTQRTVFISEVDHKVSEERLADLFSILGQVLDCRVCGDPFSNPRFAFVEFSDESSARAALSLSGIKVGSSKIRVMPSKTAIHPVDPALLPQSEEEREKCARTICCTNIDKQVTQAGLKSFFEAKCGEVSRMRLLGDKVHSTRIAFVEFVMAESAVMALDCCGMRLGRQQIRVNPSKTPVRARVGRAFRTN
ncbi:polyadenylate-binding protein-interacting protein 9-like [Cynara cardunculus var. scolymus]|uniref:Nucleotide-binding, alpha-beta plait n=1 Tax=Cynara cardunculus var. scolymus TaxID=59895 RepID=A0A103Y427_CYNCS|nr:polyadenylate-binding protein-interacting protein 9-like [Cynara cardunculus var. scolymus]KVI02109.1 Nucleotide-binding, alpha-beta plait [Cynara cardunculus var. scolymus]